MTGRFITFEGIDGAGKSTHIQPAAAKWRDAGRAVTVTREPGGTELAETLRETILHTPMDGIVETLLVFAARRDHLVRVIQPALGRGDIVLCDRFTDATYAYQGFGRGQDLALLRHLEESVQHGLQPDLTLWFDVDPGVAADRRSQARAADRFEVENLAFFERVRRGYAARMAAMPGRFVRIDASCGRLEVERQVNEALEAAFDA